MTFFLVQKTDQGSHQPVAVQENVAYGVHEKKERMEMTSNVAYAAFHQPQRQHPPESSGAENLPEPSDYY